jgi:hypothetical protein
MRNLVAIALAVCLLASCGPNEATLPVATPTGGAEATPTPFTSSTPPSSTLVRGGRIVVQSASLSLTVEDPGRALAQIESAIAEVGGVVVSSSSWSSPGSPASSNLSARVPPAELGNLRRIATGLASQVQSDGVYSQDATADYRRLNERLRTLALAEDDLLQLLTHTSDKELATSLMMAYQMVTQERATVQSQISDYEDRATLATFDVSLNGPAQVLFVD